MVGASVSGLVPPKSLAEPAPDSAGSRLAGSANGCFDSERGVHFMPHMSAQFTQASPRMEESRFSGSRSPAGDGGSGSLRTVSHVSHHE